MTQSHKLNTLFVALIAIVAVFIVSPTRGESEPTTHTLFKVPDPTGKSEIDLKNINETIEKAILWQSQHKDSSMKHFPLVEVRLGPGTYSLCPNSGHTVPTVGGRYCLSLNKAENMILSGDDATTKIVLLNPNDGYLAVTQSNSIIIKNLQFDFGVAPYTQGRIRNIHLASTHLDTIDVELDVGYQGFADALYQIPPHSFGYILDATEPRPKAGVPDFMRFQVNTKPHGDEYLYARRLGNNVWRLKLSPEDSERWDFTNPLHPLIRVGDRFVFIPRIPDSGIAVSESSSVTLSQLTIYAASGLTALFKNSYGPLICDHVVIKPQLNSSRALSSNADGLHFQNSRGPISITNSTFEGMADDAILLYGIGSYFHTIQQNQNGAEVFNLSSSSLEVGDVLQIVDHELGTIRGYTKVLASTPSPCPLGILNTMCSYAQVEKLPVGTTTQDIVYNYSGAGSSVIIKNNVFGPHRGSGVTLLTPNALIENNSFNRSTGPALVIGPFRTAIDLGRNLKGPIGPIPDNITITNNTFQGVGGYGGTIHIGASLPSPSKAKMQPDGLDGPHQIRLTNNAFSDSGIPTIDIESGADINFVNTKINYREPGLETGSSILMEQGTNLMIEKLMVHMDSDPLMKLSSAVRIGCATQHIQPDHWSITTNLKQIVTSCR